MSPRPIRISLILVASVAAVAGFWLLLRDAQSLPDRPQPIAWDRDSCAHCRMLVGEPEFAAQVITSAGAILNFDDPGCLVKHLAEHDLEVHRVWFHAGGPDLWLGAGEVAFERTAVSPMGYGFAATAAPGPGAIGLEQLRNEVLGTREVTQP